MENVLITSIFSTKHEQQKTFPSGHSDARCCHEHTRLPHFDSTAECVCVCVCERVFSYAYRWSWCEKASPITVVLLLSLGVARIPFAPSGLFSILKTSQISSNRKHLARGNKEVNAALIGPSFF